MAGHAIPPLSQVRIEIPAHKAGDVNTTLAEEKAHGIIIGESHINLRGGIFRLVDGSNQLLAISSGRISVDLQPDHLVLTAQISFLQMLLFISLMLGAE